MARPCAENNPRIGCLPALPEDNFGPMSVIENDDNEYVLATIDGRLEMDRVQPTIADGNVRRPEERCSRRSGMARRGVGAAIRSPSSTAIALPKYSANSPDSRTAGFCAGMVVNE
jgi:hypothetical protein